MCCNAAAAIATALAVAAVATAPSGAIAAATVTVVATLAAAAATSCQGMGRGIPDGKHSDHQLMYSMVQLAVELEGDAASGGAGSVGSDVLAFKAHEAPQQVLQHCTAGDACTCKSCRQAMSCCQPAPFLVSESKGISLRFGKGPFEDASKFLSKFGRDFVD